MNIVLVVVVLGCAVVQGSLDGSEGPEGPSIRDSIEEIRVAVTSPNQGEVCDGWTQTLNVVESSFKLFQATGEPLENAFEFMGGPGLRSLIIDGINSATDESCSVYVIRLYLDLMIRIAKAYPIEQKSATMSWIKSISSDMCMRDDRQQLFAAAIVGLSRIHLLVNMAMVWIVCPSILIQPIAKKVGYTKFGDILGFYSITNSHPDQAAWALMNLPDLIQTYRDAGLMTSFTRAISRILLAPGGSELDKIDSICRVDAAQVAIKNEIFSSGLSLAALCHWTLQQICDSVPSVQTRSNEELKSLLIGSHGDWSNGISFLNTLIDEADERPTCYHDLFVILGKGVTEFHTGTVTPSICSKFGESDVLASNKLSQSDKLKLIVRCNMNGRGACGSFDTVPLPTLDDTLDHYFISIVAFPNLVSIIDSVPVSCRVELVRFLALALTYAIRVFWNGIRDDVEAAFKPIKSSLDSFCLYQQTDLEQLFAMHVETETQLRYLPFVCENIVMPIEGLYDLTSQLYMWRFDGRLWINSNESVFKDSLYLLTEKFIDPQVPLGIAMNRPYRQMSHEEWIQAIVGIVTSLDRGTSLFIPHPEHPYSICNSVSDMKQFEAIGRVMAIGILRGIPVPLNLPTMFFARLLNKAVYPSDFRPEFQPTAEVLERLFYNQGGQSPDEESIDIPRDQKRQVTRENLDSVIDQIAISFLPTCSAEIMDAVRKGFDCVIPIERLRMKVTPYFLRVMMQGDN